ncbi:MAG: restriction endonuclease subunit S [Patescibacteria group bacterium]
MHGSPYIEKNLDELCDITGGLWIGKSGTMRQARIIRNTNFKAGGHLDFDDVAEHLVEDRQFSTRELKPGDIILEKSGGGPKQPVGRVALFQLDKPGYTYSNFTARIRVKDAGMIDPRFLWHCLQNLYMKGVTNSLQRQTSGIRNLETRRYGKLLIPVPPLKTQKQIVSTLDQVLELKTKRDSAYKILSDFAPALFDQMFGNSIDQNFLTKKLSDVVTVKGGGTPSKQMGKFWNGVIPWVSPKDMGDEFIEDTEDHITQEAIAESATNLIPPNSLLVVTRSGILKHTVPIAITARPVAINQDIKALIPSAEINPIFLYWQLRGLERHLLTLIKTGATVQSLNTDALTGLDILVPPKDKQVEFVELVENSAKIRGKQLHRGQLIDEAFSALTAQLL